MDNTALDACRDEPSSLDWEFETLFGAENVSVPPDAFFATLPRIQNQTEQPETGMACTRYGMTHIVNSQNLRVAQETAGAFVELFAKDAWAEYVKANPTAQRDGATLQSALEQFRKNGHCTGYAKANGWEKEAISTYRLLLTGSLDGNWYETKRTGIYTRRTDGKSLGHCFCIYAYDEDFYYAINSLGDGTFKIRKADIGSLFTRYAVTDVRDEEAILAYRKSIMDAITIEDAKKAVTSGIWNGTNPQAPATRQEVAAMIERSKRK